MIDGPCVEKLSDTFNLGEAGLVSDRVRLMVLVGLSGLMLCSVCLGVEGSEWRGYVRGCLDTLIERGTDRYGSVESPMLMAVIDVETLTAPEKPKMYDSYIRTEGRPGHGRRSPGGCNLWLDQPTLKAMYRCSEITGDSKYAEAADAYIGYALKNCVTADGLLIWGSHIYYDAYKDKLAGDGQHEILILLPAWEAMYRVNPVAVRAEVDAIWKYHVIDHKTGAHNRHNHHSSLKADFVFSGSSYILAFGFMYSVTGEEHYLDKAKLLTDWHWEHRNKETNLVGEAPLLKGSYGGGHCYTSVTGPFVSALLRCYEMTGKDFFRDIAVKCVKAYDKYGWDEKAGMYYGILTLEGKAVMKPFKGGYDGRFYPAGYIDIWRTIMYSYEYPLIAAQTSLYAYEKSGGDAGLLEAAMHWSEAIEKDLPPHTGRRWKKEIEKTLPGVLETVGTYAENYGRAISFYIHLYRATRDRKHLVTAEMLAREAVSKLYENGLFKGHPAKPYYEACDGVGFLLYALLELDAPDDDFGAAF